MLFILDLDLIKNVLVKDFDHFMNRRGIEFSDEKFDKMLFNMINQDWKDLRATMSPTFTTSKLKRMFGVFNESAEKMVKFLEKEIKNKWFGGGASWSLWKIHNGCHCFSCIWRGQSKF